MNNVENILFAREIYYKHEMDFYDELDSLIHKYREKGLNAEDIAAALNEYMGRLCS